VINLRLLLWSLVGAVALVPTLTQAQSSRSSPPPDTLGDGVIVAPASPGSIAPAAASALRLPRTSAALRTAGKATVLAIGSSSTVGIGASSPAHTYEARLEVNLETSLKGTDFIVVGRGLSGEVAEGAAARMKREVDDVRPDLVIWQVGTNDALRHVAMDGFKRCLTKTLAWLKDQKVDVLLLNPQYGELLVKDAYYEQVVGAIAGVAHEAQVLLVDRFGAMRKLGTGTGAGAALVLSPDNLHMNDEGYDRLGTLLAQAIIGAMPREPSTSVASVSAAE
jgi:lysophospholipase L1-like esterase